MASRLFSLGGVWSKASALTPPLWGKCQGRTHAKSQPKHDWRLCKGGQTHGQRRPAPPHRLGAYLTGGGGTGAMVSEITKASRSCARLAGAPEVNFCGPMQLARK